MSWRPRPVVGAWTLTLLVAGGGAAAAPDPLAAEVARWARYLRENPSKDETWTQIKQSTEPALAQAEQALRDGRRLLALLRLASARENLSAMVYLGERPEASREDAAAFESEWKRMGDELRPDMGALPDQGVAASQPAAVRALAEAARSKVRVYYEASLEYGRNTMPSSGLFYLGAARAQREFAAFAGTLREPKAPGGPSLRPLEPELEALESELLAAYRPPASIDRHREFIVASATVKEARELGTAGLQYGALLRYLQAALRVAPFRPTPVPAPAPAALAKKLAEAEKVFAPPGVDHSLGRLFVEAARAELATPTGNVVTAAAIVDDVLPRYRSALAPASPAPPREAARVTVTLVRWPYT